MFPSTLYTTIGVMELDKELYRQAYQLHQQWYEAELKEQVRTAGQSSQQQAWQQYLDLWSFGRQIQPESTLWQQEEKMVALVRYYDRVQRMEAWRNKRGEAKPGHGTSS